MACGMDKRQFFASSQKLAPLGMDGTLTVKLIPSNILPDTLNSL